MNGTYKDAKKRWTKRNVTMLFLGIASLVSSGSVAAQTKQGTPASDALHQLNASIEALVQRVSPAVVQIIVTGYGSTEQSDRGQTSVVIGRQRAIGSGIIVDPEGYIVTNAHVLNGAEKIEVFVPAQPGTTGKVDANNGLQGKSYQARMVGVTREIDLAVIKIEAHGLPALSLGKPALPAQGEVVFAFGSPEGLRNTVTMGVVSAVARQPDPDSPLVYVQTDTPINPGNSGGPLVNADGNLVGINTFIFSTSGGNQGLGFAIPAGVVAFAYPQLLKYGHIHQPEIGVIVQTITPELAEGLHLQRDFGVIVSDVVPGSPAESAGLKIQDIILSVDGAATGKPASIHPQPLHARRRRACESASPAGLGPSAVTGPAHGAATQNGQPDRLGRPGEKSCQTPRYSGNGTRSEFSPVVAGSSHSYGRYRGSQDCGSAARGSASKRGRHPCVERNDHYYFGRITRKLNKAEYWGPCCATD